MTTEKWGVFTVYVGMHSHLGLAQRFDSVSLERKALV